MRRKSRGRRKSRKFRHTQEIRREREREEALSLYRDRFGSRKVDLRTIRSAIKSLGVGIADDATLGAVFGTVRQIFRTHEAWKVKSATLLKNALRLLGLVASGGKQALSDRIHNAFPPMPQISEVPPLQAQPAPPSQDLDESLAEERKCLRAVIEPSLHEANRVAGHAGEYAANYLIIYDDELEVDDYSADSKGVQAECGEISASGRLVNPGIRPAAH